MSSTLFASVRNIATPISRRALSSYASPAYRIHPAYAHAARHAGLAQQTSKTPGAGLLYIALAGSVAGAAWAIVGHDQERTVSAMELM